MTWLSFYIVFMASAFAMLHQAKEVSPARHRIPGFSLLHKYNISSLKPHPLRLPSRLREISGLACTTDGRLLCHDDERGIVYQINESTGDIIKEFSVGKRQFRRDYEGIAAADSFLYLVTSDGKLLEFREAQDHKRSECRIYDTGLSAQCNAEGLCYDPESQSLLIACKDSPSGKKGKERNVYSFSVHTHTLSDLPRFTLDAEHLSRQLHIDNFRPSSIERHPESGTFFILSSAGPALLELSPDGKVLAYAVLPRSIHPQPEGLTFGHDLTLYISNEGKVWGTLVAYPLSR